MNRKRNVMLPKKTSNKERDLKVIQNIQTELKKKSLRNGSEVIKKKLLQSGAEVLV